MSASIHHNTAKRADTNGLRIIVQDGEAVVTDKAGNVLATDSLATRALDAALASLSGKAPAAKAPKAPKAKKSAKKAKKAKKVSDEDGEEDGEDEAEEPKSVIKAKYRKAYKPFKMSCGDELAKLITGHVRHQIKKGNKQVWRLNRDKLVRFAKANGVWVPEYLNLNVGMIRMNVRNRLAPLVAKGHEIKWTS